LHILYGYKQDMAYFYNQIGENDFHLRRIYVYYSIRNEKCKDKKKSRINEVKDELF